MNNLPLILGGVGAVFGTVATYLNQRTANINKRFDMLFGMQGASIKDLTTRATNAEAQVAKVTFELLDCERSRVRLERKVDRLESKVAELKALVPNGTSIDE